MHKILLIGQPINKNRKGLVGGGGGYVRNMRVYLEYFQSDDCKIIPCFHTSRKEYGSSIFSKMIRLIIDFKIIIFSIIKNKPDGIHIMAQYRDAIPREVMYTILSKLFKKPLLYEIKAGAFINSYLDRSNVYKILVKYILLNSKIIVVEGKKYIEFIEKTFHINSYYFPNIVPDKEIPPMKETILKKEITQLLFVGYCNYDKGVFQLIEACGMLAEKGLPIELNLIGEEDKSFSNYLNKFITKYPDINIHRFGSKPHDFIMVKMQECDIFCYPTFHKGEGHSNSINEAMMNTMVIIATKNGFLANILDNNAAYFIEEKNAEDIYETLITISNERNTAVEKAKNGYKLLIENYTVSKIKNDIDSYYLKLIYD